MPYRSDLDALESRAAALETELKEARQAIAAMKARRKLATIAVASPCPADWETMVGDERVRFCEGCRKHVYNLSAMTAEEAMSLVEEREGELCARFYRRLDGTVLTSDCPVGRSRKVRQRLVIGGAAAALAATLAAPFMATTGKVASPTTGEVVVMPDAAPATGDPDTD